MSIYSKKIKSRLLVCITLMSIHKYTLCARSLVDKITEACVQVGTVALAVGGAALAIGGTAKAVDWLMTPSDSALLQYARRDFDAFLINHHYGYKQFQIYFNITMNSAGDSYVRRNVLNQLVEPYLYDIAIYAWNTYKKNIEYYPRTIRSEINLIVDYRSKLSDRIRSIEKLTYVDREQFVLLEQMKRLTYEIDNILPFLSLFVEYIEQHEAYFILANGEWHINDIYVQELDILTHYRYDSARLFAAIDDLVYQKMGRNNYPFIKYAQKLDVDIVYLRKCCNKINYNYADRIAWADSLLQNIEYIRSVIDSAYKAQVYAKERHELELRLRNIERLCLESDLLQWKYEREQLHQRIRELSDKAAEITISFAV